MKLPIVALVILTLIQGKGSSHPYPYKFATSSSRLIWVLWNVECSKVTITNVSKGKLGLRWKSSTAEIKANDLSPLWQILSTFLAYSCSSVKTVALVHIRHNRGRSLLNTAIFSRVSSQESHSRTTNNWHWFELVESKPLPRTMINQKTIEHLVVAYEARSQEKRIPLSSNSCDVSVASNFDQTECRNFESASKTATFSWQMKEARRMGISCPVS